MTYVTRAQIEQAREIPVLDHMQKSRNNELVHVCADYYCTREHDSLRISPRGWYWWSRGIGGKSAIDYLVDVENVRLPDAVLEVLGTVPIISNRKPPPQPTQEKNLIIPPKHADNRRVFAYLKSRGIDPEIINHFIKHGKLYESGDFHNAVFTGFKDEQPRHCALRGTLTEKPFKGEAPGSDKRFPFSAQYDNSAGTLHLYESPIDLMSYLSLNKLYGLPWRDEAHLSLCGVYKRSEKYIPKPPLALEQHLKDFPDTKQLVLHLDNDDIGREASSLISQQYPMMDIEDRPPKQGKDLNELLQMIKASGQFKKSRQRLGERQ